MREIQEQANVASSSHVCTTLPREIRHLQWELPVPARQENSHYTRQLAKWPNKTDRPVTQEISDRGFHAVILSTSDQWIALHNTQARTRS